ncbi:MAG: MFS transporter [Chromatiales bacterium]|nr:MFS transporter [Chromatiales bacterium]
MPSSRLPGTVYLLALCQALMMSSSTLMVTAAALVGYSLATDKALSTLPLALQFLATMATTIPAAWLLARIGRKAGFMAATALSVSGGAVAVLAIRAHEFWWFCAAAVLLGMFNAFGSYYRFAAADIVVVADKARAISMVLVGGVIAAFVGPNLANFGQHLLDGARFAGSFVFVIGMGLLSFVLLAFTRYTGHVVEHPAGAGRPLLEIVRQRRFIVAVLCAMLGYGVMSFIMTATPLAMEHHHHEFSDTAFVIEWHVLGMFAPAFVTGRLIRRFGVERVLWTGAVLGALTIVINLAGTSLWHFWVALLLLGVSWNFLFIGGTTLLTETYRPEERAKAQAINDFSVFTATTLASLSAGAMLHRFGWWWVNVGVIPLVMLIVAALVWLALDGRRSAATTAG